MKLKSIRALLLILVAAGLSCTLPAQQLTPAPHNYEQPPLTPSGAQPQPSQAQPPPPGSQPVKDANGVYTIHRSARLVVLDLVVTDAKGNIVTDLSRDQFHVTEANEPQTILNFEAAGAHTLDPDITIDSTEELDRLAPRAPVNILLLDEFNTHSKTWPLPGTP
jgi:hypothetical protein